jgi:hypothetical protein
VRNGHASSVPHDHFGITGLEDETRSRPLKFTKRSTARNLNGEKITAAKCRFFGNGHFGFWAAAVVAAASLGVLFAWPMVDASYRYAKHLAAVDIGWNTITPTDPVVDQLGITATMLNAANQPNQLGRRVVLLYVLSGAACVATVAMVVFAVRYKSPSRVAAMAVVLLCGTVFWGTRTRVEHWSDRRRAANLLPQAETVAVALAKHWPTKSGPVPPDLNVAVDATRHPNILVAMGRKSYSLDEDLGYLIERSPAGTIRFSLSGAYDCQLEYHPNGSEPGPYVNDFHNPSGPPSEIVPLREHWYFVHYGNE